MLLLLSSSEFSRCSLSSYPPPERRCWGHDWLLSATSLRGSPAGPRRVLGAVTGMRAAVLGLSALVWSALVVLSCGLTGPAPCPRALDCARLGRHFCRPGTSHCGPCLQPLVQNSRGRCVFNKRRAHHVTNPTALTTPSHRGTVSFPELDEQIDMLSAIITEQRSKVMLTAPPPPTVPALSAPPTEMPTNHSASSSASPSAPPTAVTNHSSALLSAVIEPRPPSDVSVFIVMSSVFIVTGSVALMIAGACWVRLQRGMRLSQKVDYPPHGLMRPHTFSSVPGDRRLVQSAQMFHYQHQRQQMLSIQKHSESPKVPDSGASSDDDDGDFTVYECPGLAPTGEMEVKNPLFDDSTLYFHRFHK